MRKSNFLPSIFFLHSFSYTVTHKVSLEHHAFTTTHNLQSYENLPNQSTNFRWDRQLPNTCFLCAKIYLIWTNREPRNLPSTPISLCYLSSGISYQFYLLSYIRFLSAFPPSNTDTSRSDVLLTFLPIIFYFLPIIFYSTSCPSSLTSCPTTHPQTTNLTLPYCKKPSSTRWTTK